LAVRPDAYTLQVGLMALAVWAALRWRRTGAVGALVVCAGATGAALFNHLMIVASLPGLAALVVAVPGRQRGRLAVVFGGAVLLGLGAVGVAATRGVPVGDLVGAALRFRPGGLSPRGAEMALGYLVYQFPLTLLLAAVGSLR